MSVVILQPLAENRKALVTLHHDGRVHESGDHLLYAFRLAREPCAGTDGNHIELRASVRADPLGGSLDEEVYLLGGVILDVAPGVAG